MALLLCVRVLLWGAVVAAGETGGGVVAVPAAEDPGWMTIWASADIGGLAIGRSALAEA